MVNEPPAQIPHQQAILGRHLPNLTEEGYQLEDTERSVPGCLVDQLGE